MSWAKVSQGPDMDDTERFVLFSCHDGNLVYIPESGENKNSTLNRLILLSNILMNMFCLFV